LNTTQLQEGLRVAIDAQKRSYSPYSSFAVGAALKCKDKDLWVPGCNVENASYGGTICAERIAVFNAISAHDCRQFEAIVLVTKTKAGDLPCAFCLQVLSEFVDADFPVYSANQKEIVKQYKFSELLPHPFDKTNLEGV
jgi:cytidine deaminase